MNAISLFSGIGGMDIGFAAAGFDIVAQVELDDYCQRILTKHKAGWWPHAALFADVRDFGRASIARDIDVVFGGFPCQPHSTAGKRLGAADHRNLWPEFRRIVGELRPRAVLLENVPGILSTYATVIVADLAALGYDAQWGIISAADAGAPHLRKRWWCVAYARRDGRQGAPAESQPAYDEKQNAPAHQQGRGADPDAAVSGRETLGNSSRSTEPNEQESDGCAQVLAESGTAGRSQSGDCSEGDVGNPFGARLSRAVPERFAGDEGETAQRQGREIRPSKRSGWRTTQRRLGRATYRLPDWLDEPRFPAGQGTYQHEWEAPRTVQGKSAHRVSRIQALGNAVVPQIAYTLACGIIAQLS